MVRVSVFALAALLLAACSSGSPEKSGSATAVVLRFVSPAMQPSYRVTGVSTSVCEVEVGDPEQVDAAVEACLTSIRATREWWAEYWKEHKEGGGR